MRLTQRQINTLLFVLILAGALLSLIDVLRRDAPLSARLGYATRLCGHRWRYGAQSPGDG